MKDLVERKAVIDLIHGYFRDEIYDSELPYIDHILLKYNKKIVTGIKKLPVVKESKDKTGEWIPGESEGVLYCSKCGNEAYWDTDYGQQLFEYCPYCGSKNGRKAGKAGRKTGNLKNILDNVTISECKKEMPCIDCDNTACWFQGKKESDCPKYKCDNPTRDCESGCAFIDGFIDDLRKEKNDKTRVREEDGE